MRPFPPSERVALELRLGGIMVSRHLLSAPILWLASGCAVVGPIYDRSYENAPNIACADLSAAGGASVGQQPVRVGCFDAVARTFSAGQQVFAGEHMITPAGLKLTGPAAFRFAPGETCRGDFTNFVVEYSTGSAARATVTATDGLGRHLGMQRIAADDPKRRRLVLREMGDPLKFPTTAEFTDVEGELIVSSVCLKGY